MKTQQLFKLFLAVSAVSLVSVLLLPLSSLPFNEKSCRLPLTTQYFWYGEDVATLFRDNSILTPRQTTPATQQQSQPRVAVDNFPWLSDKVVSRAFSKEQHGTLLNITHTLAQLLETANVTYMMSFGTLLGSYIFHDVIPWDDDMDFLVDINDLHKVKAIFQNEAVRSRYGVHSFGDYENMWHVDKLRLENATHGLDLDIILKKVQRNLAKSGITSKQDQKNILKQVEQEHHMCKIWRKENTLHHKAKFFALDGQKAGKYNWTWPFVDLIFYESVGDEICTLDQSYQRMCQDKSVTFPLSKRLLGNLWLPAPRDSRASLQRRFPKFSCMYGTWDHIHERWHKKGGIQQHCNKLHGVYPLVHRQCQGDAGTSGVKETLRLGEEIIHTVFMPNERCPKNTQDVFSLD